MSITIFNTNPGGGGGTVDAANGTHIDTVSKKVYLGGPLVESTDIDRAGFELFIHDESLGNGSTTNLDLEPGNVSATAFNGLTQIEGAFQIDSAFCNFSMDNALTPEQAGLFISLLGAHIRTAMQWVDSNTGNAKRIAIDNVSFLVEDQVANKGIEYAADYSANFTANSLISAAFFFANLNPKVIAAGNVTAGPLVTAQLLTFADAQKLTYRFNGAIAYISGTGTVAIQIQWNDPDLGAQTFTYTSLAAAGVSNYPPFVFTAAPATPVNVEYIVVGTVDGRIDGYLERFM